MKLIEAEYPDLEGILPKSYQEFDDKLLRDLVRVFNKDAVKHAKGDVFGRIYEFFLMKFSMPRRRCTRRWRILYPAIFSKPNCEFYTTQSWYST